MKIGQAVGFNSWEEFEKSEGKIVGHVVLKTYVVFFTKEATYRISKKMWRKAGRHD